MRAPLRLRAALLAAAAVGLLATALGAAEGPSTSGLAAKGYLSLRYAYVGTALKDNSYQGLRLTGSFELSAFSGKVSLKYRSHHWITIQHTKSAVLASPFENRSLFQSVYLETRGVLAKGLKVRLGRMYPEMDYASLLVMDGGWLGWEMGSFYLTGSVGRTIDYWSDKPDGSQLQATGGLSYRTGGLRASVGFNFGQYFGLRKTEIPAGISAVLSPSLWLDVYGSYDLQADRLARAGLSLSWRVDRYNFSLIVSQWTNPFDEIYQSDKNEAAFFWVDQGLPVTYRDVRLTFSWNGSGFGFRGSGGWMGGVRKGWLGNGYLIFPSVWGIRLSLGGQAMRSDFIEFYSGDVSAQKQFGGVLVQVQSQTRYYQWRTRPSDFHNMDTFTQLSVDYPLVKHFYLSLVGGGFFRRLGNETFLPQVEFRIIYRI